MKDFSFKKLWNDITGLFKSSKKNSPSEKLIHSTYSGDRTVARNALEAETSRETLKLKNQAHAANAHHDVATFTKMLDKTKGAIHNSKQKMYERLFTKK